jgi:hypothetical protein
MIAVGSVIGFGIAPCKVETIAAAAAHTSWLKEKLERENHGGS